MPREVIRVTVAAVCLALSPARDGAADPAALDVYERSAAAFADGLACAERGLHEDASRSYREAIGLDPGFVEAMVNLARIHLLEGDPDGARDWLERALRLAPAYPSVHAVRGLEARQRGDLHEALRAFTRARVLDPGNVEVLANLGATLLELGLVEDARVVLEEVRRRDPARPEPVLTLALLWERRGDAGRAAYFYAHFLSLVTSDDPARTVAEARLRKLQSAPAKGHRADVRDGE